MVRIIMLLLALCAISCVKQADEVLLREDPATRENQPADDR